MMEIQLDAEIEVFVKKLIERKLCHSADEAINQGLYLLRDRFDVYEAKRARLREKIEVGLKDLENGRMEPLDMVMLQLKARLRLSEEQPQLLESNGCAK